ncbi:MAG: diaminopimelate dehydrogenase [Clostridia bacterium]|nr:diaminopimelate dehydrogenase [Clostridia bacterium]
MIRVGIYGYGNLGKGVELAIKQAPDMECVGVFTRRNPETLKTYGAPAYGASEVDTMTDKIDVMIVCGGSATDLPVQTPDLASKFNVIDSFDNHAEIPNHFAKVDEVCRRSGKTAVISVGWDPGLFSIARAYASSVLPDGKDYTFWGKGVSQGHSDAIRRIEGVADARQYTVPIESALEGARSGLNPEFTTRQKHKRVCFVVAKEGANKEEITRQIVTMPNYFEPYDTEVNFISQEEMNLNHSELPHGGFVIRSGKTGLNGEHNHIIEYRLKLDSNPEFTASVLVAYARAAVRLNGENSVGCKTVFDIPPAYISTLSGEELRKKML